MTSPPPTDRDAKLLTSYEAAASQHGQATRAGDHRRADQAYSALGDAYRELRAAGRASQMALLDLLDHADPSVRGWAAAHALEFAPERGEAILKILAAGPPSPERLDAEITLREWRRGTLQFP